MMYIVIESPPSAFDLFIYFVFFASLLLSNEMTVIVCWTRIKLATDRISVCGCEWIPHSFTQPLIFDNSH